MNLEFMNLNVKVKRVKAANLKVNCHFSCLAIHVI